MNVQPGCEHACHRFLCGQCEAVSYCGSKCADHHWYTLGHYALCCIGLKRERESLDVEKEEEEEEEEDDDESSFEPFTQPGGDYPVPSEPDWRDSEYLVPFRRHEVEDDSESITKTDTDD